MNPARDLSGLVTVLVALRNEAKMVPSFAENLRAALDGARLVVVDDASDDGTGELVKNLLPTAVVVPGPGRGLARALNAGLSRTCTPFVARADADDLSIPGRFRRQLEALEANPSWVACATRTIERRPGTAERLVAPPSDPHDLRRMLLRSNPITHGSTMMRMSALQAVGGYDARFVLAQDYDLWLRLLQLGDIGVVEEVLYVRYPPTGKDFRAKRRRQTAFSARAQLQHWRRTREIDLPAVLRNLAGAAWPGPRPSELQSLRGKRGRTESQVS